MVDIALVSTKGLVTNYGEGGGFTPTKRGGRKSFRHAEGGAQEVLG